MRRTILALALSVLALPAYASGLVGQWCDRPLEGMVSWDNMIRIEIHDGAPLLRSLFPASEREVELIRRGDGVFVEIEGRDGYRISGEDLELFDDMGVIRVAHRLDDDAAAEECWR